jgi:hypothetical protein
MLLCVVNRFGRCLFWLGGLGEAGADAGFADRTGLGHEGRLLLGHAQHVGWGSGDGRRIVTRPARECGSRLAGQAVPGGLAVSWVLAAGAGISRERRSA